jgi:hypothetical protein
MGSTSEGHWESVWYEGYWTEVWVDGYEYTVVVRDAYDETVTVRDAYDEVIVIRDAYTEEYVISPERTETVTVTPARTETITIEPARTITVEDVPGRWINVEVSAGRWDIISIPGYWTTQEVPGRYVTVEVPGYWTVQTIAASVLGITSDGQSLTGIAWSTGRSVSVPTAISDFLDNPDWLLDEEEGDNDDPTTFTAAFGFRSLKDLQKLKEGVKQVRIVNGKLVIVEATPMITREEAAVLINIYLISIAHEISTRRRNPRDVMSFVVYEKHTYATPRKVYTGRTAGWGTPDQVLARRDAAHRILRPDLEPAVLNASTTTKTFSFASYAAMRGREQQVMDWHDLNQQPLPMPNYNSAYSRSANAIRGVARSNRLGMTYYLTACDAFYPSRPWEYTGFDDNRIGISEWPDGLMIGLPFFRFPLSY